MNATITTPYRAGWVVTETPGPGGYARSATRNGRTLEQGAMTYHQFVVAMDRIAGLACWEDILPGLMAGLSPEEAQAAAVYTEDEAWARAECQAQGLPWERKTVAPVQPPPIATPAPTPAVAMAVQPSLFGEAI